MLAAGALIFAGCGAGSDGGTDDGAREQPPVMLHAAGTTAGLNLIEGWARTAEAATGVQVAYRSASAREGLERLAAGAVGVAVTDVPLEAAGIDPEVLSRNEVLQIPLATAPIAIAYNLDAPIGTGIGDGVRLDARALEQIYRRWIYNWVRRGRIVRLNRDTELVDQLLTLCRRADPASATAAVARYAGSDLRADPGPDYHTHPIVLALDRRARGDDGVGACVRAQIGALGYLTLAEARRVGLGVAALRSGGGDWVLPSAGAAGGPNPSYPLTVDLAVVMHRDPCEVGVARETVVALQRWLRWALGPGQRAAPSLHYAPLSAASLKEARARVRQLSCEREPVS